MDVATLPGWHDDAGDGGFGALVRVRDHQLHALPPAADEIAEEGRPERLGFARTNVQPDDLAIVLGGYGDRYYRRDADDAAALADLEVGGVEPKVRPLADEGSLQERVHAFVDVFEASALNVP